MKKFYLLAFFLLAGLAGTFFYFFSLRPAGTEKTPNESFQRIISLSPSTTETLFALGLGDRVVGVTRFCNFPPAAKDKAKVGGYFDPNYEAITALKPDLVLLLPEQEKVKHFLDELGIKHLTVDNKTIADILATISTVSRVCGAEKAADSLIQNLENRIARIRLATQNLGHPKVLISIGRSLGSGTLQEVYAAGQHTSYDELVQVAGGRNAFTDETPAYPLLSAEGILQLNPDFILDLVADLSEKHLTEGGVVAEWHTLGQLKAVQQQQVFVLSADYTVIPGPRFILLLEDFARILHPELRETLEKK